jgi:hypothetical protein
VKVKVTFTEDGFKAISLFENKEIIDLLNKYISLLSGKFGMGAILENAHSSNIILEGAFIIRLNDEMGITKDDIFFYELAKCMRSPLTGRYKGILTKIFITELLE